MEQHIKRFSDLTGIDVSEEAIWDKGSTFDIHLSDGLTVTSNPTAETTVTRNEVEEP